jgi:hypothetical protein
MQTRRKFEDPMDDPAMRPVYEAGGGDREGYEQSEAELVEHASHGDWGGTTRIFEHAENIVEENPPDPNQFGEPDDLQPHELRDPEQRSAPDETSEADSEV